MISIDTETTGIDLRHGARPFFVTTCDEAGENLFWEWDVDPYTRRVEIPLEDIEEIVGYFDLQLSDERTVRLPKYERKKRVLQNSKFDVLALSTIGIVKDSWPWEDTLDTLISGHLLASNQPHDLTVMALVYLGVNIKPLEDALEKAVKQAQNLVRKMQRKAKKDPAYSDWLRWRIAKKDDPDMPSAKEKVWKFDSWLPKCICKRAPELLPDEDEWQQGDDPEKHSWWRVLQEYANADSSVTLPLHKRHEKLLHEKGLWRIYEERLKVLPIAVSMENIGVTLNERRLTTLYDKYWADSKRLGNLCTNIAATYDYERENKDGTKTVEKYSLNLPKGANNNSLRKFVFDVMKLEPLKKSKKTGEPSLDAKFMEHCVATLPERSKPLKFVESLGQKRKADTACSYMRSYKRYWFPVWVPAGPIDPLTGAGWYRLHPWLNPTGSDTLRWSSSNPNEQNISKKEGFNIRSVFGPAPGREWWSMDAQNIELRIPAYEAGETEMVNIFERPNDPPYYGSYHLLVFDTLHPEKFAKDGVKCKDIYESTWYQWTKNGNFAVGYGSVEQSGTADRAYHVPGAFKRIKGRFSKIHGPGGLNDQMIAMAERLGYVETMVDNTLGCSRGYPLLCTRTNYGKILPTVPLNYHVQGTAMWWMQKAMIRCYDYLRKFPGYHLIMQVHDELVFDFPQGRGMEPWLENLPKIRKIKRLMEEGGNDIGIPTPVSIKYHAETWSEGKKL